MNLARLSRLLYELDVPSHRYRLDGSHFELAHVIVRRGTKWIVFLSERGGESSPRVFDGEDVACIYLFDQVTGDLADAGQLHIGPARGAALG
jgi:hypothetical protein